jgi:hypothetical protein
MRLVLEAIRLEGENADSRRRVMRRAVGLAGTPPAMFTLLHVRDRRLVSVGSHL